MPCSRASVRQRGEHGIHVDESLARGDAVAACSLLSRLERAVEYNDQIDPIGDAARLIGAEAAGVQPSLSTAVLARHRANRQKPEGDW